MALSGLDFEFIAGALGEEVLAWWHPDPLKDALSKSELSMYLYLWNDNSSWIITT